MLHSQARARAKLKEKTRVKILIVARNDLFSASQALYTSFIPNFSPFHTGISCSWLRSKRTAIYEVGLEEGSLEAIAASRRVAKSDGF